MLIKNVELEAFRGFPWRDLRVTVDRIPELNEFIFEAFPTGDGSTLYVGTCGVLVRQFVHNPSNEHGFGGSKLTLRMRNGETVTIKGPWSSRAEVTNEYCPDVRCCEVVLLEDDRRCGIAGINVTEPTFRELARMAGARVVEEGPYNFYATAEEEA